MSTPPDRNAEAEALFDDFQRRLEGGETLDFERFCAEHPELRADLIALRDAQVRLDELLPAASSGGPAAVLGSSETTSGDGYATTERTGLLLKQLERLRASQERLREHVEVARGAMGIVYSAFDSLLRRRVAVKVALARPPRTTDGRIPSSNDPAVRGVARFLDEAQITSQLDHPGIVPVHDLGLDAAGQVFFSMRLVRGEHLQSVLRQVRDGEGGWSQVRAIGVLLKVCEAMTYAHSKGVIHRDLKPSNIMVGRFGEVYVMDWGLARLKGQVDRHDLRLRPASTVESEELQTERGSARMVSKHPGDDELATMDGDVVGTPAYMSPEQARGRADLLDERSDVYSVGAILYQLISGEVPFVASGSRPSGRTILARVLDGPPRSLESFGRIAPSELIAICSKALARDRMARYGSMRELAEDLRAYLESRVVHAYETGAWAETRKWLRRNWAVASAAALVLVLSVVSVTVVPRAIDARRWERALTFKASLARLARDSNDVQAWPSGRNASDVWIGRAQELVNELERFERLRARASARVPAADMLQFSGGELQQAPLIEIEQLARELLWCKRVLGEVPRLTRTEVIEQIPPSYSQWSPLARNQFIFNLVRTDEPRVFGFEDLAVYLAEQLVTDTLGTSEWHPRFRDTLAFALLCVDYSEAAVNEQMRAVAEWRPRHGLKWLWDLATNCFLIQDLQARWSRDGAERRRDRVAIQLRIKQLEFESDAWSELGRFDWGVELNKIVADLVALKHHLGLAIQARNGLAGYPSWDDAIAAIHGSARYQGVTMSPQLDLVPLRVDPKSGLWEFLYLPSGEPPLHDDGGTSLHVEAGIVFVLLPGRPSTPDDDVTRNGAEAIDPFFVSKFELTRHQWTRLTNNWGEGTHAAIAAQAQAMSWLEAGQLLSGVQSWMNLPTLTQLEYASRVNAHVPWWAGESVVSLYRDVINLFDGPPPPIHEETGRDVVSMLANPGEANGFGLVDTHSSLAEWFVDCPLLARSGEAPSIVATTPFPARFWLGEAHDSIVEHYRTETTRDGRGAGELRIIPKQLQLRWFASIRTGVRPVRQLVR
jgi:serine/threonine protein kinase